MKRVLVITSRFPWPPFSGDRLRGAIWLDALAGRAEVALVSPHGSVPSSAPPFRFFPAKRSIARGVSAALRVMRESLPLQSLLAAPFEWSEAIERAKSEAGPFDATIVLLSRLHPWISVGGAGVVRASGAPPAQRRAGGAHHSTTILDAIDSLTRNASERASQASPLARWFWRIEERRVARAEADAAKHYERVLFVSDEDGFDREQDGFAVVSNGVAIHPLEEKPRRYDFGFWGRLAYFANSDAAEYLLDEIWPRIRERRASATLAIGGAHATKSIRRKANQAGVTLTSPVDHMPSFSREIRVALLPLRYGSGESTKTMEAAESGCAIVGSALAAHARILSAPAAFADAAVALLDAHDERARMASALRAAVIEHHARQTTLDRLAQIALGDAA